MRFPKFVQQSIVTQNALINLVKGGSGPPLLLLHGYPQTLFMWHEVAPRLAENFTVIAADLRGYGDSSKPAGERDHRNYAKRTMAEDLVEVMWQLGYKEFYVAGHDRGGRVAHRLTLDHPDKVKKLAVLDIVPTYEMYSTTDQEFARAYYHWFFLIQPYPLPETLILGDSEFFLRTCLQQWSQDFTAFTPEALAEYSRCFCNAEAIHSTCEDYRAGGSIDLDHDQLDLTVKINCPVLVLWGDKGIIGRKYNVLECWRKRATQVQGKAIASGHFLPEEAPENTYLSLVQFFLE